MVYSQTRTILENKIHKVLWDFKIQTNRLIPARRPNLVLINKEKKRTRSLVDFSVPADPKVNMKENDKIDEYLGLPRELKKRLGDTYSS